MSTTNNQVANSQMVPLTALSESKGDKEALFQVGMSGLVSAALLEVKKILSEVANLMGKQFIDQIEAAKTAAKNLAKSQRQQGAELAQQSLVTGLTQVGGGVLSLGTLGAGEIFDKVTDNFELKETDQQLKGIKGYKNEINNRTSEASINENKGGPVPNANGEFETQELNVDNKDVVAARSKALNDKDNFINGKKKAQVVAEQKGADGTEISDKVVIKDMTEGQASDFKDNLDSQEKTFLKKRDGQLGQQSSFRQTISTVSQGLNGIVTGSGTAGASVHAADAAKAQASATEGQAALQGFQQVSGISQGQFTKLVDEANALSDNLKAVANANALVGG